MQRAFIAVAMLALACLLVRSARVGLAGDYIDPISKVTAQDEALYANGAIRMARVGDWLTPRVMGRFALYKPPLLMWVAGLSARLLGVSRWTLRLPVDLLCALAVGLVFLWAAELRSWQAGVLAAALVVSNHLWHVLGGMCMTDGLLVAFETAAMYFLFSDPWLESKVALWGFAGSVAAAILTKSVAGVVPLAVLGLYWLAGPRKQRPAFLRVCVAAALSLALAAPWFVFQMTVHGRWFWAEHVGVAILGFGAGAPPQTAAESHARFYFLRMAATDPVLTALTLVAVPGFLRDVRRRTADAVLLLCWLAVPLAAVFVWHYRNIAYLLPGIPALAILAAGFGPFAAGRPPSWMLVLAAAALVLKVAFPSMPWGISFAAGTVQRSAPLLSAYCERGRANELIVVDVDDDFYAATLPLPKLRYCLVGGGAAGEYGMPFDVLGITLTAAQFNDLPRREPEFRRHLREWGLDSAEPIGTVIMAATPAELEEVIRAHPASDFLVPNVFREAVGETPQVRVDVAGHFFLLAREGQTGRTAPAWSCRM